MGVMGNDEFTFERMLKALEGAIEQKEAAMTRAKDERHHASVFETITSEFAAPAEGVKAVFDSLSDTVKWGINEVKQTAQEDPWDLLKKVAVGSFSLGMMIGSHYKRGRA